GGTAAAPVGVRAPRGARSLGGGQTHPRTLRPGDHQTSKRLLAFMVVMCCTMASSTSGRLASTPFHHRPPSWKTSAPFPNRSDGVWVVMPNPSRFRTILSPSALVEDRKSVIVSVPSLGLL